MIFLEALMRLDRSVSMRTISKNEVGMLFTIKEFQDALDSKFIVIGYDGSGVYATKLSKSDIEVCEDLKYQHTFTHILWYNK